MTHSFDAPHTHGHFTDRGCSKCRDKDREIERLKSDVKVAFDEAWKRGCEIQRLQALLEAANEREALKDD